MSLRPPHVSRLFFYTLLILGACACGRKAAPEPAPTPASAASESAVARTPKPGLSAIPPRPKPPVVSAPGDPEAGNFTLDEATAGLPGNGKLMAEIDTDFGKLDCELYGEKAPITVANFVGLARGTRAWLDNGAWVKKPLYNGTVFHRVVKGFMIQGGDPNRDGSGGPGFTIEDEIWEGALHDTRGQLCMANRGPNTNGSQFFVMDGKAAHLDGKYTIFGLCGPDAVLDKLVAVEVAGDRSLKPTTIKSVTIRRGS